MRARQVNDDKADMFAAFGLDDIVLEDQNGLRSWAFEPNLELHHQAADAALAPVLDSLRDHWLQGFQRKPNPSLKPTSWAACA